MEQSRSSDGSRGVAASPPQPFVSKKFHISSESALKSVHFMRWCTPSLIAMGGAKSIIEKTGPSKPFEGCHFDLLEKGFMSEDTITECIGRLATIQMHLEHAGMSHALHHVSAAIDALADISVKLHDIGEPMGTA